jgi:hypothetical protein
VKDFHSGLRVQQRPIGRATGCGVEFLGAEHQWGKADFEYSLHAYPNQFTTSGLQTTDFLALLGFERRDCAFNQGLQCYSIEVRPGLDLSNLPSAFDAAYTALSESERHLANCGIQLPQREGWAYFTGRQGRRTGPRRGALGDGHTASQAEERGRSEDDAFRFVFSWMSSGATEKGWVVHLTAKNQPMSAELTHLLQYIGLRSFNSCQFLDFDECWWLSFGYAEDDHGPFNRSIEWASRSFDGLAGNFSPGLSNLLKAHALLEPFGLKLLPIPEAPVRMQEDLQKHVSAPRTVRTGATTGPFPQNFDVAISYAGPDRPYAEQLANQVRNAGFEVFYDDFYPAQLWGKNLYDFFHEIYSKRARFCVMFVSRAYAERLWTNHELQSAQERMFREKGGEYILPIRIDDTELSGMHSTIGYVSIEQGINNIGSLLIEKLRVDRDGR